MGRPESVQWQHRRWLGDNRVLSMDWDAKAMHFHLLMMSIQEEPPGSIPDDMALIRRWLGSPSEDIWRRVRPQVLSAWTLRTDRWFNVGMVETFERKEKYAGRYENGTKTVREKPENQVNSNSNKLSVVEVDLKKELSTSIELIYSAYPRKIGKGAAAASIGKALERLLKGEALVPFQVIGEAASWLHDRTELFAHSPAGKRGEYTPHPSTWYNQKRYLDDEREWQANGTEQVSKAKQRAINNLKAVGLIPEEDASVGSSGNGQRLDFRRNAALGSGAGGGDTGGD